MNRFLSPLTACATLTLPNLVTAQTAPAILCGFTVRLNRSSPLCVSVIRQLAQTH
jgi:hypothetical protein